MHVPVDIYMFGSPQNYDNSPTEHGLIETAKRPADHAQKSNTNFVSQVTKRVLESTLIKKAKQALSQSRNESFQDKPDAGFSNLPNSASFHVTFNGNGQCIPNWLGKKSLKDAVILDSALVTWLHKSRKDKKSFFYDVDEFCIHFEYMRNGITFRCHPNYRSNGAWYDWVMVQFELNDSRAAHVRKPNGTWSRNYFPSKIMCFFTLPKNTTVYAIVHSTKVNSHDNNSILFERWELENTIQSQQNGRRCFSPTLHVVEVDTFGNPVLAIEDYKVSELELNTEDAKVTVVTPFETVWPKKFMSSYRR